MGHYRVNEMIQKTCKHPDTIGRLNQDPEAVFEEYGFSEDEKKAFRDGSVEAMGRVGVHPLLQMHWMMARNPEIMQQMSILEYEGLVEEG